MQQQLAYFSQIFLRSPFGDNYFGFYSRPFRAAPAHRCFAHQGFYSVCKQSM
jgi:hypothetical protein